MGYKLKRILIYPDGVTEKQVYPKKLYEYNYDFRNKSVAICQSDGWAFSSTSTVTINSDGLSGGTPPTNIYCTPSGLTTALSGANKITMEMMFYKGSRTGVSGTNATLYLAGPSSYTSNGTGMGCGFEEISGNFYYSIFIKCLGSDKFRNQYTVNNGTYTSKLIIDLVNKTMRGIYGNIVDTTQSLTDAQISTIRTLKYVRIYTDTTAIIKTVGIAVD